MPVEIRTTQSRVPLDMKRLKRRAELLLKRVDRKEQTLSVLITDDRQMAALH